MAGQLIKIAAQHVDPEQIKHEVELPRHFEVVFRWNPQYLQPFMYSLIGAVQATLEHPDTKPSMVTQNEIKARLEVAKSLAVHMYFESEFSMRRVIDRLEACLLAVYLQHYGKAKDVGEIAEVLQRDRSIWGVDAPLGEPVPLSETVDMDLSAGGQLDDGS